MITRRMMPPDQVHVRRVEGLLGCAAGCLFAQSAQARATTTLTAERVCWQIDQAEATICGRRCAKVMARNTAK